MTSSESCTARAWRWTKLYLAVLAIFLVMPVLAGWIGDISKDYFNGESLKAADVALFLGGLTFMLVLVAWLVAQGRALLPAKVIAQNPSFAQRRVVIALLSPCEGLSRSGQDWTITPKNGTPVSLAGKTLEQLVDKNASINGLTWQQTLRAAHYHQTRLERLVLVGSLGSGGSGTKKQLDQAQEFFSTWFPGKVHVYGKPATPNDDYDSRWQADFEDLGGLNRLLDNLLEELHRDTAGYSDRDIIIDSTGGYKVTSIAAALATLHRADLMFQYVGTGPHAGRVTGFNVSNATFRLG